VEATASWPSQPKFWVGHGPPGPRCSAPMQRGELTSSYRCRNSVHRNCDPESHVTNSILSAVAVYSSRRVCCVATVYGRLMFNSSQYWSRAISGRAAWVSSTIKYAVCRHTQPSTLRTRSQAVARKTHDAERVLPTSDDFECYLLQVPKGGGHYSTGLANMRLTYYATVNGKWLPIL